MEKFISESLLSSTTRFMDVLRRVCSRLVDRLDRHIHEDQQNLEIRAHFANDDVDPRSTDDATGLLVGETASICSNSESVYSCSNLNRLQGTSRYRIPARSVREQVRAAPSPGDPRDAQYPKHHSGYEHWEHIYKLRSKPPWVEFPILTHRNGRVWTQGHPPGPVRAVYNDADRSKFDVVYHDRSAARRGVANGFTKAIYRPGRQPLNSPNRERTNVPDTSYHCTHVLSGLRGTPEKECGDSGEPDSGASNGNPTAFIKYVPLNHCCFVPHRMLDGLIFTPNPR
ncbi:uncharacterized protein P884DRAFT_272005 [Thermothelomyces heterothallicus CBS 202.75]|uniref:uncharacterized protein n=1 Tax=Thermothelomyces heterothallicus CBS 202.75 TaxID=1149848 RepID=UPI003743EF54